MLVGQRPGGALVLGQLGAELLVERTLALIVLRGQRVLLRLDGLAMFLEELATAELML